MLYLILSRFNIVRSYLFYSTSYSCCKTSDQKRIYIVIMIDFSSQKCLTIPLPFWNDVWKWQVGVGGWEAKLWLIVTEGGLEGAKMINEQPLMRSNVFCIGRLSSDNLLAWYETLAILYCLHIEYLHNTLSPPILYHFLPL